MAGGQADASLGKQLRTLFGVGTLTGLSDGELLDRFLARDADSSEPAFAVLVDRHGPMVLGVCRRLLGDGHLAEDAFQATFLILARRAASIRGSGSIGGWLHRVARRAALRARQQADRRRSREATEIDPDAVAVASPDPGERLELRSAIDEELDRLNEAQRQAVVLCCVQGMSHEQAAGLLRWPVGTVKSRLGRGREQLRERLTRRGFAPAVAWPLGADLAGANLTVSVPKALADATAGSAFQFVAGSTASMGAVASAVANLANRELTAMMLGKWKVVAMALAASTAAAGLAGIGVAWSSGAPPQDAPKTQAVPAEKRKEPASSSILLSARGRVVDPQGKPIAGATVYLREWSELRTQGLPIKQQEPLFRGETLPDILAQTRTDAEGQFRFNDVQAPPFSEYQSKIRSNRAPWDVVATADGHALAWANLSRQKQKTEIVLTLPEEATIRGRIAEPGGKPVAGAKVQVFSISPLGELGYGIATTANSIALTWSSLPITAISDAEGRFQIRGLPRDMQMRLVVTEARHERKYLNAATTKSSRPILRRRINEYGKPYEVQSPVLTGDLSIEMKPTDHRLIGRVVFEADGKPAAGATVLSGWRTIRETDASGRFELADIPTGRLGLHIHLEKSSVSAPLDIPIEIPAEPKVLERTFVLPRGLAVQGKVMDAANRAGIGGVEIQYSSSGQLAEGKLRSIFGLSAKTEADGQFRIVVPPGPGSLKIQQLPPAYDLGRSPRFTISKGEPRNDDGLSRTIDGKSGQTLDGINFALNPGGTLTLRAIDADGSPIPGAIIKQRDWKHHDKSPETADRDGRFQAEGLDAGARYTFDVYHPTKDLGARFVSPSASSHEGPMAFDVKLKPLAAVRGKVLTDQGQPLQEVKIRLGIVVEYPDSFGPTEATLDAIRPDGSFRFDRLIPGVEYDLDVESAGFAKVDNTRFTPKPGETHEMPEFRLPVFDRVLSGVVVDPRGKPIAGATISFQWDFSAAVRYAPAGRHFQDTDEDGQFRLDGLPRGKIKVMAYRRPAPPSNSIKNMVRVEVEAGQNDIRLVLPDENQRLQGIED